jgi:hypothetical protein
MSSVDQLMNESSSNNTPMCGSSVKSLIFLFIIVLVVLSTSFTNYVISSFKSATTDHKEVTSFGTMIQATSVVILYALLKCFENYNIL